MGFVRFLVLLIAIFALFSMSILASGFEISGVGTKARGMAGAFRSVADDWTAAYYNPAGYARLYDSEIGANFAFVNYRYDLDPNFYWGGIYSSGIYNDQVNYNNHEILSNPSGGFLTRLPLFGEVTTGLSVFQLFDQNNTWNLYDLPLAYNDSLTLPDDQYSVNLDVVAFQLTVAKDISDNMSVGIGLQLLRADLIHSNIYFRTNPYYPSPIAVRPWDKVTEIAKVDGNGYGFGVNLGVLYDISEKAKLGLNAKIPFNITVDGDARLSFFQPKISYIDSSASDDPGTQGTAGNLFVAGAQIDNNADFESELKLPTSFGFGLSYQLTEKFLISFDAEYTLLSKFEGLNYTFTNHRGLSGAADTIALVNDFFTADLDNPVEWQDCGKVALGMLYDYNDYFTFLGGVSADQSPSRENGILTPQFIETGDTYMFNFGLIWHYRQYDFGFVTSYSSYPVLSSPLLVDENEDGIFENMNGLYSGEFYETVLSFNYRF